MILWISGKVNTLYDTVQRTSEMKFTDDECVHFLENIKNSTMKFMYRKPFDG